MNYSNDILGNDEKIIFDLRAVFSGYGYKPFRLSRFEEYELYSSNRAFLPGGDIIAFTGAGGKLMALRPDVTLSIVKSITSCSCPEKLYYNENIYRTIDGELRELMQIGLESLGNIGIEEMSEVLVLAKKSLDILGSSTRLDISHMGFINGLISSSPAASANRAEIMQYLGERNTSAIVRLCESSGLDKSLCDNLIALTTLYGPYQSVKDKLVQISANDETNNALAQLDELHNALNNLGVTEGINIDFSIINDITYYNGIIFQGFIESVPEKVLSGGRYDELVRSFGKDYGAIGFAVYPDFISRSDISASSKMFGIALPKGRLGKAAYQLLEKAGLKCPGYNEDGRRLFFDDTENNIRYFLVKPADVAVYVERGAADIGIIGKDALLETHKDVFELIDLKIGKCKMCVAAKNGFSYDTHSGDLKVATSFPNIARDFYTKHGVDIDIIKLNGSVELAPLIRLSDVIVDLVETGRTLEQNNMVVIETITDITARLIANKAAYKYKYDKIMNICNKITEII